MGRRRPLPARRSSNLSRVRRAAEAYVAAACPLGFVLVIAFTLAGSTPPGWVLDIVLVAILIALAAVLYVNRVDRKSTGRREHRADPS